MRINRVSCLGLVIDIQEKLFPHIYQKDALLNKTLVLLEGLRTLGVPLKVTEQYPKGLGPTLEQVIRVTGGVEPTEKISFSCCDEPAILESPDKTTRNTILVCGIEAHVCVLQTVVDLIHLGFLPVVVADCISSRSADDRQIALERMRTEGAVITTCESILFELARRAGTEEFRAISRLVK